MPEIINGDGHLVDPSIESGKSPVEGVNAIKVVVVGDKPAGSEGGEGTNGGNGNPASLKKANPA